MAFVVARSGDCFAAPITQDHGDARGLPMNKPEDPGHVALSELLHAIREVRQAVMSRPAMKADRQLERALAGLELAAKRIQDERNAAFGAKRLVLPAGAGGVEGKQRPAGPECPLTWQQRYGLRDRHAGLQRRKMPPLTGTSSPGWGSRDG